MLSIQRVQLASVAAFYSVSRRCFKSRALPKRTILASSSVFGLGGLGTSALLWSKSPWSHNAHFIHCESSKSDIAGVRGIAVVTGASRGIGAATAVALAREGYAVAVNYKGNETAATGVVDQIHAAGGIAEKFKADVAVENEVVALFDTVQKLWPKLNLTALVNNAGVLGSNKPLDSTDTETYHAIFNVNVLGPLIASREFVRRATSGGAIVNISSGSAGLGDDLYGMSKVALNGMQAWLVKELAPHGIRMNTVSPGTTRTDMMAEFLASNPDLSGIPMRRVGEPEEIADAVVFLLSDKSSYVHGANIRIAGGCRPGSFIG